jgi:hypothetical protein
LAALYSATGRLAGAVRRRTQLGHCRSASRSYSMSGLRTPHAAHEHSGLSIRIAAMYCSRISCDSSVVTLMCSLTTRSLSAVLPYRAYECSR